MSNRIVTVFQTFESYYLLSDPNGQVQTYPKLWMAYKAFIESYEQTVGRLFHCVEVTTLEQVLIKPSLSMVESAAVLHQTVIPEIPELLKINGIKGCLYGITTKPEAATMFYRGRNNAFIWLQNEIDRKESGLR